ncbi:type I glyceraldehyde-3-phosphate dehydrogenase [Mesomycoplasma moatsii]|uniref:type I glyceraldehyde-3-phosphate dehydrogenase n=1 Tax=Mesomycoplasma moatsii TaxID=171287 RepID=UPI0003B63C53
MAKRIAINGFGRIGRLVFRQIFELGLEKELDVVAINDLTSPEILAHLLKYDSAQGKFNGKVKAKKDAIIVNDKEIKIYAERDPKNLPWKKEKIDVVVESTGFFTSKEKSQAHIDAGAKKVAISAPAGNDVKTIVFNVNDDQLKKTDVIISGASCTTNCLAPIAKAIDDAFGIKSGLMTTVHAYTGDQRLVDAPHSDLRRARAAAVSIVPSSTGAAKAIGLVLPKLAGKLDGFAMRVPVITGSVVDLTFELEDKKSNEKITIDMINDAVKVAAKKEMKETLEYLTDPIVSRDIIGSTAGSLFDPALTKEIVAKDGKKMFKVVSWYDNETSYVSQFVRTLRKFAKM